MPFLSNLWSSTFTVCDIYCCPVVVKCNYIIQLSTFDFEHLTGNRSTLKMITSRHSRGEGVEGHSGIYCLDRNHSGEPSSNGHGRYANFIDAIMSAILILTQTYEND